MAASDLDAAHAEALRRHRSGDLRGARLLYEAILERDPEHALTLGHLGLLHHHAGEPERARPVLEHALRVAPGEVEVRNNLAIVLRALGHAAAAEREYRRCIAEHPDFADPCANLANLRKSAGALREAENLYREGLRRNPRFLAAYNNLGVLLLETGRLEEARSVLTAALGVDPDNALAHLNIALTYEDMRRYGAAIGHLRTLLGRNPGQVRAMSQLAACLHHACDWESLHEHSSALADAVERDPDADVLPFLALYVRALATPPRQRRLAGAFARRTGAALECAPVPRAPPAASGGADRLRVGYLSADFHDHATAHLMRRVFALHDRARFEVLVYSYGPRSGDAFQREIQQTCDTFVDLRDASHAESAARIARDGTHILVDLKGYTIQGRPKIAALRPAPVQVSYLGYPGTTGAPWLDYLVTDRFVTPFGQARYYSEKLVYLPHCYQVNDSSPRIARSALSRADLGLPGDGFVFCCFNASYKIEPEIFAVWMRLLRAVPGSVLWLMRPSAEAEENLRRVAHRHGSAPGSLVFADPMPKHEHLARHRAADLFLDTLTYNAHTTATDALQSGVPLVTLPGSTFASRVAGSLLTTLGVPELIADDLAGYEKLALRMATDGAYRSAIRKKIESRIAVSPLFDTPRTVRALESAYRTMWEIHASGADPAPFSVVDAGPVASP